MKINSLAEITDANLKEMTASALDELVKAEIKKISEDYAKNISDAEKAKKDLETASATLTTKSNEMQSQLDALTQELNSLKAANVEREKNEKLSIRLSALDEKYNLASEDRQILGEQIKELSDEAYADHEKKLAVLLKEKIKQPVVAAVVVASTAPKTEEPSTQKIVDDALSNGVVTTPTVPSTSQASQESLADRAKKHFGLENWNISVRRK
jgi:predicted nuclease with TOPRIM domain